MNSIVKRLRRCTSHLATLLLSLVLSLPALAQDSPAPMLAEQDVIVVTGQAEREVEAAAVRRQAQAITPRPNGDYVRQPLAMFQQPLCPGVVGLQEGLALRIANRMRTTIENIGLETHPAGDCAPNIWIAFVHNSTEQVEQLRQADHFLIANLSRKDRNNIQPDPGPVYSWMVTSMRDSHGGMLVGDPPSVQADLPSHMPTSIRRDIEMAVVLIEISATVGKTTSQLADYAIMRTLARTRPPQGEANLGTILELFNPGTLVPEHLTDFDNAYLQSLYSQRPTQSANATMRRITGLLREMAETEDE